MKDWTAFGWAARIGAVVLAIVVIVTVAGWQKGGAKPFFITGIVLLGLWAAYSWIDWPWHREKKRCPDCAEYVAAEANVCKHCGYRFDAEPA